MRQISRFDPKMQGFTLIELSVVLFLIGLLFSLSLARTMKATVQLLRSKSIVTHKNTVLHCDLDNGVFWGSYQAQDKHSDLRKDTSPLVRWKHLPKGIRFLDASNINTPKIKHGLLSSTFNPKGFVEETVLHLSDENEKVLTIIINAYTGRFLLYDEYVDVEYE
jgi:general secretion pathway protein H